MLSPKVLWCGVCCWMLCALAPGCGAFTPEAPAEETILDGPIEGLSGTQLQLFVRGDEEFGHKFSFTEGLGPIFNAPSCDTCHPGDGRAHPEFGFVRFGRYDDQGVFDPMFAQGGPQLQDRSAPGYDAEALPGGDVVTSTFLAPAVTGLGLLESIDDEVLLALADPEDEDGDGISGRVHWVAANDGLDEMAQRSDSGRGARMVQHEGGLYLGRFGRKASNINLVHQTVAAYRNDMGITSDFALEDPLNSRVGSASVDVGGDPEIGSSVIFSVTFYLRTLRPPSRRNASDPDVVEGQRIFTQIGCGSCHTPSLTTGRSDIEALDRKEIAPYTDLLLHDMGPELDDGYAEGNAESGEWRTPPLWGLGLAADFQGGKAFYMHDGRAGTLVDAIALHGGEGERSREAFAELSKGKQAQLIRFLESL